MKRYLLFIFLSLAFVVSSAKDKSDLNKYEIEIAEIGQPGMLVIKTWCYSKKANISEDVFKECAVKGIMFKGLNDSGRMKGRKPLVIDGYDNHKDYFDNFFKNEEYQKYARMAMNGYVEQNSLMKVGKLYKVGKIVVISFNELRARLEEDNIIKGLNSGF
ncbi:MAG: hypothetical protein Q4E60_10265 [Bacteroidales bacterium]|nr:hypothetical protein [Bacteroidales bacterium]